MLGAIGLSDDWAPSFCAYGWTRLGSVPFRMCWIVTSPVLSLCGHIVGSITSNNMWWSSGEFGLLMSVGDVTCLSKDLDGKTSDRLGLIPSPSTFWADALTIKSPVTLCTWMHSVTQAFLNTRREFFREVNNIAIISIQHSKIYFVETFGDFSHTVEWSSFKSVWQIFLYVLAKTPRAKGSNYHTVW